MKLLESGNHTLAVSEERISTSSPTVGAQKQIQRWNKLDELHIKNQDDQKSWQYTKGIGLKLSHEPNLDWKTNLSLTAQEFDTRIRRSSFIEHPKVVASENATPSRATPAKKKHKTATQNFNELFRNLDIPENVDVQEFEESYLIEFDQLWILREKYRDQ